MKKAIEFFGLGVLMILGANLMNQSSGFYLAGIPDLIFYSGIIVLIIGESYCIYKGIKYIYNMIKQMNESSRSE